MPDFGITEIAIAGAVLSAVGTGVAAYGQVQQGEAAQAQAAYQAGVYRNNQILAERAAEDEQAAGRAAVQRSQLATKQLQGRQRAVLAGNGVQVDTGGALDITSDTAAMGALDQETIRNNAERKALAYRAQGANFQADAQLATMRGDALSSAGDSAAFGTLLSGAGSVASKWYSFSKDPSNSGSWLAIH